MSDLSQVLGELPRLAQECYAGPWTYEFEDCRATLTKFDDITVVAIPGTHGASDMGDLLADGLLAVGWHNDAIGWAPEGSLRRASRLHGLLKPALSGKTVLTGHSLGGAFAQLLAALMAAEGAPPIWLETFGAPHSAGDRMVKLLDAVPGIAFQNWGDPIPYATGGLWEPWRYPQQVGSAGATFSIQRHFMEEYRALLAQWVAA